MLRNKFKKYDKNHRGGVERKIEHKLIFALINLKFYIYEKSIFIFGYFSGY